MLAALRRPTRKKGRKTERNASLGATTKEISVDAAAAAFWLNCEAFPQQKGEEWE